MENDFQTFTVEEISLELGDAPFGSNLKNTDYTDDGALVIQGKNIQGRICDWGDKRHVSLEKWKSIPRSHCFVGDLIFPKVGTIGKVGLLSACNGYSEYLLSTNTMRLRVDPKVANQDYVYYYFSWSKTSEFIKALNSKSVQPVFNFSTLKKFKIELPSLAEQKAIAHILGSLDDKIELNRQMNATLEAMAQALFKSWFVDFDPVIDNALAAGNPIPDELEAKAAARQTLGDARKLLPEEIAALFPAAFVWTEEMGWIPEGWGITPFGEILENTIGGDWGKETQDGKHTEQAVIIRGTDIPDLKSGLQSSAPTRWVEQKKLKTRQLEDSDIVIEISGGSPKHPTGRSLYITKELLQRLGSVVEPASFCRRFKPLDKYLGLYASLHLEKIYSDGKMWEYQNQSTGISNFQTSSFLEREFVLLPKETGLLRELYSHVRPLIKKISSPQQIQLAELRDTLLPKLLSGELRIPEAEQLIKEAVV